MESSTPSGAGADPPGRPRRQRMLRAAVAALLAVILVAGFALRAQQAQSPAPLSADERAYGRIALTFGTGEGYGDEKMREPYHWAPGAPALFAAARAIGGDDSPPPETGPAAFRIREAYWAQAAVGTLLIGAAFALAALLSGGLAGLAAAAAVAFYPPLVETAGHQLSEPLGALCLTAGVAALAGARRRPGVARLALGGVLLGLAVLARADLLLAPLVAAAVVWAGIPLARRRGGGSRAALTVLAAGVAVIAPWIVVASTSQDRFVPVSDGGAAALYVGTYLPGGGTLSGLKHALARETRRREPMARKVDPFAVPADLVLRTVAARHPDVPRQVALRREAQRNLREYALGRPRPFLAMMADKAGRMWLRPVHAIQPGDETKRARRRTVHLLLLSIAVAGLVAGLWRSREPVLGAVAAIALYSTLDNAILIAEARHNLPLLPALYAAGAAGWALLLRGWGARSREDPAVAAADCDG